MNHNIIVYSTPTCPYCVFTKEYFKSKGITFSDIDVSRDRAKGEEMVRKSGQMGVPVIDIDGNILVGFHPNEFDKLLK